MSSKNTTEYRHRVKQALVPAFGDVCYLCKRAFPFKMYELHHLNPNEKSFQVCSNTHSIPNIICEAKKCIMVCPNCHRMITLGYIFLPSEISSNFNEETFINIYNNLKPIKSKLDLVLTKSVLINYLKNGYSLTEIGNVYNIRRNTVSKYCKIYNIKASDYKMTLNKVLDRKTLKKLIREQPFTTIAKTYNVTDKAISKLCKKYNLPYRRKDINAINDDDWLNV